MILFHLLALISPAYGLFCESRWMYFENSCYKRFEAAPSAYINTCRTFKSVLVENVTASEAEFIQQTTVGGPMGSGKGDFICKKAAASKEIFTPRTRPWPRNELDCSGNPNWFGLNETKRCYSRQFSHQPLSWDQANTRCQNLFSGKLATMKTELEYNHVINVGHFGTYGLTYEQPLIGYRRTGNDWKWVDGTQGGITLFHGGIPDPKLNQNCAQVTTDIAIEPDHQVVYNGVFGRMVPVPCNQRFQRFICSVDHATFVTKFPVATTTSPSTGNGTYCPTRWLKHEEFCYRPFAVNDYFFECSSIDGENFEIPEDTTDELFLKMLEWKAAINDEFPYHVCRRPTINEPPPNARYLSEPKNDFDCFSEGWNGLNRTGKCYKCITDLYNQISLDDMRGACQTFGGALVIADDYKYEMNFLTELCHTGVPAYIYELPVLENFNCGKKLHSDELEEPSFFEFGTAESAMCMLSSSFICSVPLDEMKQRYG